jgi:hypothetical protein
MSRLFYKNVVHLTSDPLSPSLVSLPMDSNFDQLYLYFLKDTLSSMLSLLICAQFELKMDLLIDTK